MDAIVKIKKLWKESGIANYRVATINELQEFQNKYKVVLPYDMMQYFLELNGTLDRVDYRLFRFYSLEETLPLRGVFSESVGIPRNKDIFKTLSAHESCFIWADHSFGLFFYAIKLNENIGSNQVYIIQGGNYEIIADSFSEFLELYLKDDATIYI